jgi:hypothetical protein
MTTNRILWVVTVPKEPRQEQTIDIYVRHHSDLKICGNVNEPLDTYLHIWQAFTIENIVNT